MPINPVGNPTPNSYLVSFGLAGEIFHGELVIGANGQESMDNAIQVLVDHLESWGAVTDVQVTRSDAQLHLVTPTSQP